MKLLGIDIGGSGIKGALVDTELGQLIGERHRIATPTGALPQEVAKEVAQMVSHFAWNGPIGCTFPAIVHHGVTLSAANVDQSWIGTNAQELFEKETGLPVHVLNDADAAGIAEIEFGAGRGRKGVVMMLTFGTGIGSAIFLDGKLLPNSELGHLEIRGKDAEHRASAKVKEDKDLSWKQWAERVNEVLAKLEFLFSPDLFIIGGGVSKRYEKFLPLLKTRAEVVPAQFFNDAGIVGAAMAARTLVKPEPVAAPASSEATATVPAPKTRRRKSASVTATSSAATPPAKRPGRPKKAAAANSPATAAAAAAKRPGRPRKVRPSDEAASQPTVETPAPAEDTASNG